MNLGLALNINRMMRTGVGGLGSDLRAQVIEALFGAGQKGGMFLASDLSQSATDPVATWNGATSNAETLSAVGGTPVADVSSGLKFVKFDGVDDFMQTAVGVFPDALDELWMVAAVESSNAAVRNIACAVSDGGYSSGGQWAALDLETSGETRFGVNPGLSGSATVASTASVASSPAILHGIYTQSFVLLRSNGAQVASTAHSLGQITIDQELDVAGLDNSGTTLVQSPVNIYGLLVRDTAPTAEEIELIDQLFAQNSPVTL